MSEGNLRQQAVKSLMLAIDLENGNQDLEAYLKYLEGLSLVVTALQKDATNGDQWLFTDKVRRTLVNFAKESVDRIILLLKKQDRITDKKQEVLATSVLNTPYSDISPVKADENTSDSFNSEHEIKQDVFGPLNKSVIDDNSFLSYSSAEEEVDAPLSPLEAVRIENSQLSKKYAHRIINAPVFQRPQLRLELERRIAENVAIAENKQLVWDAEKEKAALHYRQLAQQKCKQLQKPKEGDCSNSEAELQDVTYSCFMFEWENKLRTMNGTLEVSKLKNANEELLRRLMKKSMDMGVRALMGSIRGHPLGSFMVKRQQSVYHEINSILSSNQVPEASMTKEVHVVLDSSAKDSKGPLFMFYRIADEMKKDLESLEIILLSLYGPLNNNEGNILLSKTLQKIYFPALTPSIKALLRLCMNSQKPGSEVDQHTLCRNFTSGNSIEDEASVNSIQNASEMEARFRLMSLQSLPSPCEKLDCLTEVMRSLCSWKYGSPKAGAKENIQPIGADDLLSRLVSVIHSGATGEESLSHLLRMEAIFLETFLPDNMVLGEAGYCVTVLCSALSI